MTKSSLSISSHGSSHGCRARISSQRAMMLSTKVKSIRNLMNPYQLGDSSHHHQRTTTTPSPLPQPDTDTSNDDVIDIGTDIDDSAVDVDDESSFAEDTCDVAYLLGGSPADDDEEEEEQDCKISSPGSPASVIDRTIFPTDVSLVSNNTSSSSGSGSCQKSKSSSRSSERRKSSRSGSVSKKKNSAGGNSSSASPTRTSKRSKRQPEEVDKRRDQSRRLHRRSSTRRLLGSDTDDTADSGGRGDAPTPGRRLSQADAGGRSSDEDTLSPLRSKRTQSARRQQRRGSTGSYGEFVISATNSEEDGSLREERRKKDILSRSEHRTTKLALRKPRKQHRRGSTGTMSGDALVDSTRQKTEEATDSKRNDGKNINQEHDPSRRSLSRGSSHRRMIGKGSNHSDKRNKSRRGSRSLKIGSNHERSSTTNEKNQIDAISITNRTESRKDAVSKKRSKFVNQKSCKVGPIMRRTRSRRPSVQDLPPAEPMVGHGHSFSGSVSSLTISTGIASKDDFSLPSPGVFSTKKAVSPETPTAASGHERRTAALSRWQALPKGSPNTLSDGIPTLPDHDLSVCSPCVLSNNQGIISRNHAAAASSQLQLTSHSAHCMSHTTPSSITKNSSSFNNSLLSGSIQSLSLEDGHLRGCSKNKFYPEILIPETPTRSMGGVVSDLSTPGGLVSALTTPASEGSQTNSLHSKLKQLSGNPNSLPIRIGEAGTPGGYISELTTTPCIKRNVGPCLRSKLMEATQGVPVTPSLSIGVGELDTPGGVVSELTIGSSLLSGSSSLLSHDGQRKVNTWMTNVQSVMLNESEYHCRDGIPRMARRHSLDSVSHETKEPSKPPSSIAKESDFAPKAPARQMSLSSILL